MPESNKPFVVTDRRKFTSEGELRPEAAHSTEEATEPQRPVPQAVPAPVLEPEVAEPATSLETDEDSIPAPTAEQTEQSRFAYEATADRIETAIRASNPGADHPPAMNFDGLVQSIYLTAIMQLGGTAAEGERPRVDILGARQSIDMLAVLQAKCSGNLDAGETRLLDSALFELRMAFLEITQALARQAQAQAGSQPGSPSGSAGRPGPVAPKPGIIV